MTVGAVAPNIKGVIHTLPFEGDKNQKSNLSLDAVEQMTVNATKVLIFDNNDL